MTQVVTGIVLLLRTQHCLLFHVFCALTQGLFFIAGPRVAPHLSEDSTGDLGHAAQHRSGLQDTRDREARKETPILHLRQWWGNQTPPLEEAILLSS